MSSPSPGWTWRDFIRPRTIARALTPLLVWTLIALVVYVLLWPALWVAPRETLAEVMDISGDYAEQGHSSPIFYNGRIINGDPGAWFYPVTWLWRTTPVVMARTAADRTGFRPAQRRHEARHASSSPHWRYCSGPSSSSSL